MQIQWLRQTFFQLETAHAVILDWPNPKEQKKQKKKQIKYGVILSQ
jgi:hypothetical protein